MSLSIRLRRQGKKKRPTYRVVVAEKGNPCDGKYVEQLGIYDPLKVENTFTLNVERTEYWISKGAQLSETVASFLKKAKKAS